MAGSESPEGGGFVMQGRYSGSGAPWPGEACQDILWIITQSRGVYPPLRAGGAANLQSSLFMEVKRVKGEKIRVRGWTCPRGAGVS